MYRYYIKLFKLWIQVPKNIFYKINYLKRKKVKIGWYERDF